MKSLYSIFVEVVNQSLTLNNWKQLLGNFWILGQLLSNFQSFGATFEQLFEKIGANCGQPYNAPLTLYLNLRRNFAFACTPSLPHKGITWSAVNFKKLHDLDELQYGHVMMISEYLVLNSFQITITSLSNYGNGATLLFFKALGFAYAVRTYGQSRYQNYECLRFF